MNTFELIEKLCEKSKGEIEFALLVLLQENKLNFISLSNTYVQSLNSDNEDKDNLLSEAGVCILQGLIYDVKGTSAEDRIAVQRSLYFLNKSRQFNMTTLNKKYGYDEQVGKEASWYEQNKK